MRKGKRSCIGEFLASHATPGVRTVSVFFFVETGWTCSAESYGAYVAPSRPAGRGPLARRRGLGRRVRRPPRRREGRGEDVPSRCQEWAVRRRRRR